MSAIPGNWLFTRVETDEGIHGIGEATLNGFAKTTVSHAPERVTTDGHDSSPRAIRETIGNKVLHRTNVSLNNRLEQDHRGIKQRYAPMRGFGSFPSASCFCRAFDEVRQFFRYRSTTNQHGALAEQRRLFCQRLDALNALNLVSY